VDRRAVRADSEAEALPAVDFAVVAHPAEDFAAVLEVPAEAGAIEADAVVSTRAVFCLGWMPTETVSSIHRNNRVPRNS
jgi:hypothetical protein